MNQLNIIDNEEFMEIENILTNEKPFYGLIELNELLREKFGKTQKKVLVIEDDPTFEPIWDHIISNAGKDIEFYWASNPIEAQEMIYRSKVEGESYDLIISDIYLSSSITGIDLWNRYGANDNFLLISSIDNFKLIEQAKQKGKIPPPYIQKPLNEKECTKIVSSLLNMED